jgi:hypothetical protein
MNPSTEPENTTPGIDDAAWDCAGLQLARLGGQGSGAFFQSRFPVAISKANNPPPSAGSTERTPRPMPWSFTSESGT